MQEGKWLSEEALQIAVKRREVKSKGEKERHTHLSITMKKLVDMMEFQLTYFKS